MSGLLVAFALALAGAVKYWMGPALVRDRAQAALADYWDGSLSADDVEFNFFEPVAMRGLVLADTAGRVWARAGRVSVSFWQGRRFNPQGSRLEISKLELSLHCVDGRCRPPVHPPPPGRPPREWPAQVILRDVSADRIDGSEGEKLLKGLRFELARKADAWSFQGTLGPSHLWRPLGFQGRAAAQGNVLKLARCVLTSPDGPWSEPFDVDIRIGQESLEVRPFTAGIGGGRVKGSFRAVLGGQAASYGGQLAAEGVSLSQPAVLIADPGYRPVGRIDGELVFEGQGLDLSGLHGQGHFEVKAVDVTILRVARQTLESLGLGGELTRASDVDGRFILRGPVLIARQGRMVNKLTAVEASSGATFNFRTGRLDADIAAVKIEEARKLLSAAGVPGADLMGRLTRINVSCVWDDPRTLKITPSAAGPAVTEFFSSLFRTAVSTSAPGTGGASTQP